MGSTLTPVKGRQFIDRKEMLEEMFNAFASGKSGFAIYGIRRVGKTSLLKELERKISERNDIVAVRISMWEIVPPTVDELVRVMNRKIVEAFFSRLSVKFKFATLVGAGGAVLKQMLQGLKLSAKAQNDLELSVSYVRKESEDVNAALSACFSLLDHMAEQTNASAVLMLDEFPDCVDLTYGTGNRKIGIAIVKLLRTLYEDFERTSIVISGSYYDTMQQVVLDKSAPFYKELTIRKVDPFNEAHVRDFLKVYRPDLHPTNAEVRKVWEVTSGIPYNLQLVAPDLALNAIGESAAAAVGGPNASFRELHDRLTPSGFKVLRAIAAGSGLLKDIPGKEFLEKSTIRQEVAKLLDRGILKRSGRGQYDFTDNFFRLWVGELDRNDA